MRLVLKLAVVAFMLASTAQAQTYPITGINISLPSSPDSKMKENAATNASSSSGVINFTRDPDNLAGGNEYTRISIDIKDYNLDIIVKKDPPSRIPITPTIEPSGNFSVGLKEPGQYTISTVCKSGGCNPSQLQLNLPRDEVKNADGTTTYKFTVGTGGFELRGRTLSVDLLHATGANGAPGKANQPIITKDVDNLTTQAYRGNRPLLDEPASTTVKLQPPPYQSKTGVPPGDWNGDGERNTASPTQDGGGDGQNKVWQLMQGQTGAVTADPSSAEGDDLSGKKHSYIGTVTLVKGTAPNPNNGGESEEFKFKVTNDREKKISTAAPANNGDGKSGAWLPPGPIPPGANRTPSKFPPGSSAIVVRLEDVSGHVRVSSETDKAGAFNFSNLPEGKYKLVFAGTPDQSITVGPDGNFGGNLMKFDDGSISLFDRQGNLVAESSPRGGGPNGSAGKANRTGNAPSGDYTARKTSAGSDAAGSPVGFGQGMSGSPGNGPDVRSMNGLGPGMMSPPGIGPSAPAMSSPMGPAGGAGPNPMMGSAMGRH